MTSSYIVNSSDYPRHLGDLLLAYPDYVPGLPLPDGWEEVADEDPPPLNEGYYYIEGFPEKQNDVWIRTWVPVEASSLDRRSRDLAGTDNYEVN